MSYDETLQGKEMADLAQTSGGGDTSWAWATEHGAPDRASTEQLVSWLARGELPPHTLVWKPGWGEWLPALQVAELAAAFPRVTAGSRRVARAAPNGTVTPPVVPVAHYPRLRLLAKDVLSESPIPPTVAAPDRGLAPAERRMPHDRDHLLRDLVTSQVPAAVMLEAARAMQHSSDSPPRSSAERWSRLELGTFGELSPTASAASSTPSSSTPSSTPRPAPDSLTLSPHAMALALPGAPEPRSSWPAMGYGGWLLVGVALGSVLALVDVLWPDATELLTLAGVSRTSTPQPEDEPPAPRSTDTAFRALLPVQQTACIAPPDPEPMASVVDRTSEDEPAVLRVSDLPAQRLRPLRSAPRVAAALRASARH